MSDLKPVSSTTSDEISLIDIWFFLVRQKWVIVTCLLLSLLAGVAFILVGPKKYEVSVNVVPPMPQDLVALNLSLAPFEITGLKPITREDAFEYASRYLQRERTIQRYFAEVYRPAQGWSTAGEWSEQDYRKAKKNIAIIKPDERRQTTDYGLSITADQPEKVAKLAKGFVDIVREESVADLRKDSENNVTVAMQDTERQIAALRDVAEKTTNDRLVQLQEALEIAEASGIVEPVVLSKRLPSQDRLKSSAENEALYTLGVKNLSAEIAQIQKRENNDAFIANLRALELKNTYLEQISLAETPLATFMLDREIYVPQVGSPRKSVVLLMAAAVGFMLGLLIAVALELSAHLRKPKISTAR
jgi:chain length determinant protein (polysaccharide antigen chain regulator)